MSEKPSLERGIDNGEDGSAKEAQQEKGSGKIVPKDVVTVAVRSNEYLTDVLKRYPGYVAYDPKQHDITGIKAEVDHPGGLVDHAYNIVRE